MIKRWLQKQIVTAKDPERVLVFCAAFGAWTTLGPIGTFMLVWNVYKKRKNGAKPNANAKQQKQRN